MGDLDLRRLGTDYLDIYFCHRHDSEVEAEEVVRAMEDLIHQGKVLYWGTSYWPAEEIERAVGVAKEFKAFPPKAEQPPYNMLNRGVEVETFPTCFRNGIGVVVYSPLAGGLLTGKYNEGIPEGSRATWSEGMRRVLTEELRGKLKKLTELAGRLGLTTSQLALGWILRRPEVSSAIVGATRPEQLEDNVKASGVKLEDEDLEEALDDGNVVRREDLADEDGVEIICRMCGEEVHVARALLKHRPLKVKCRACGFEWMIR